MIATRASTASRAMAGSARAKQHAAARVSPVSSRPLSFSARAAKEEAASHEDAPPAPAPEQQQVAKQQASAPVVARTAGLPVVRLPPMFSRMQAELATMDRLFDEVFGGGQLTNPFSSSRALQMPALPPMLHLATDIVEDNKAFTIKADCPGMNKEDIKVSVLHGTLTISGERQEEKSEGEEGKAPLRFECSYGSFRRSFSLPPNVDAAGITAAAKDGVLTVTLPKVPEQVPQPTEVPVA